MRTPSADRQPASRVEALVLEAGEHAPLDGSVAYWVTLTTGGRPCARVRIPPVGDVVSPRFWDLAVGRHARAPAARARAEAELLMRLGGGHRAARTPEPSVSVVVCTHRRPDDLARLLDAMARLDPSPDEVVIVDNDPGETDVRTMVEGAGARYVREDRRGLDYARQAGIHAAIGEIVCFTDDDCTPHPGWLRTVTEHFEDPLVAAVTGPGFAAELETRPQIRFEESGGFVRGLELRRADWTTVAPVDAIALGAGACMAFRRSHLLRTPAPFPAELDAGTPTQSGGDHIALHSVLAAGLRVVYDPAFYVLHRHRRDWNAMHHAFWGYGVGLAAALTRLLCCEGEVRAIRSAGWLLNNYGAAQLRRALGRGDAVDVRIAWDYLRGGLAGPSRWWRSRPPDRGVAVIPRDVPDRPATPPAGAPVVSVVVTTRDRPGALQRCLRALLTQEGDVPFEVVVCDDDPAESAQPHPWHEGWRLVRTGGHGAAAARNRGAEQAVAPRLLFLDDDLVPAPDLVARHVRGPAEGDVVLIGCSPPHPRTANFATRQAVTWWNDYFHTRERALAVTFRDVLSGNMSIGRDRFLELGGFDERFGVGRREDWEWGLRVLRAGLRVDYDAAARAVHEFSATSRSTIDASWRDGQGDRVLLRLAPEAAAALPVWKAGRLGLPAGIASWVLGTSAGRRAFASALDLFERFQLRRLWLGAMRAGQGAAYWGGRGRTMQPTLSTRAVDLARGEPIPPPTIVAPALSVSVGGEPVGLVVPYEGHWGPGLAQQLAERGGHALLGLVACEEMPAPDGGADLPRYEGLVWAPGQPWDDVARQVTASTADVVIVGFGALASQPEVIASAFLAERVMVVTGSQSEVVTDTGLTLSERLSRQTVAASSTFLAMRSGAYACASPPSTLVTRLGAAGVSLHVAAAAAAAGGLVGRLDMHVAGRPAAAAPRRAWAARVVVAATGTEAGLQRVRFVCDAALPERRSQWRRLGLVVAAGAMIAGHRHRHRHRLRRRGRRRRNIHRASTTR